jgi:hypothetical protein
MFDWRLKAAIFLLRAAASLLSAAAAPAWAQEANLNDTDYHLGNGVQIGDTGLRVGGYATTSYDREDDSSPRLAIDNLSLFLWWEGEGRWKFFSELEYEDFLFTRERPSDQPGYLSLERAYLDYALSDDTEIRAGKFLTPIGRWNLIHATPLVWTTSRPLVTSLAFPTNMTGLMVNGNLPDIGNGVQYSVYGASGDDLRPNPMVDPFTSAFGTHVTWTIVPGAQLGFSYADFEQEKSRPERKQLAGVDFFWSRNRYEISAEAVYRFSDQGSLFDEKGAYIQFVAPLSEKLYAVARYETYRLARQGAPTQLRVTGLNYRINSALVLKAEWVGSKHNTLDAPDGFLTSINVLF